MDLNDSISPPSLSKVNSSLYFGGKREVYFMGEKYCYLDEHISRSFRGKAYCWVGDKDMFNKVISSRAKFFMDSISIKHRINSDWVRCEKIGISDPRNLINTGNLSKHRYYYYNFERTKDCYEQHDYKNFVGRFRANSFGTKVLVEYYQSDDGVYEYLRYYIID